VLDAEVELGLIVTEDGLNDADAPEGSPEAEKLMLLELYPLPYDTVTVADTLPPATTLPLFGEIEIENVKKYAVSVIGAFIVTDAEAEVPVYDPEPDPIHWSKAYPEDAVADIDTEAPASYQPDDGLTDPEPPPTCIVR
jgi:hypothetical protein